MFVTGDQYGRPATRRSAHRVASCSAVRERCHHNVVFEPQGTAFNSTTYTAMNFQWASMSKFLWVSKGVIASLTKDISSFKLIHSSETNRLREGEPRQLGDLKTRHDRITLTDREY
ncbi:hypothetical protein EVAR_58067_1 [Eumeta japonica]|uniref:Uncharacterized protein n=1 Tax=Eumeta variegata TaxID=151549 RepID=A0A4C2ABD5_EUMVA|nr:hypothetical protein EVAR_58067_1 [Eumeta japonica]